LSPEHDYAEILRSGPQAWNAWREKNPSTIPDLSGIALTLSERQMGPINGGPINLKSACLRDAFLRFATLSAADLGAADMSGADLVHARFDQANLGAANLSSALLDYADFTGANLTNVSLCGARLRFATLSAADLEAADMSGADLEHARFDQANLSAANLSSALLDHADFAGANLKKVKLCGASLHHAKNLTHAQLEESIGSDSAILPHYLHESVSPSVARSHTETTALKRRDLRARARHTADADFPRISSSNQLAWIVGVLLISGALVCTGFVWQHMNDAEPLDTSGAHQGLQPNAPEALMEEKAAAERRPTADPEVPPEPSVANKADGVESAAGEHPALEKSGQTVPQTANAHAELKATNGAKPPTEAIGPNEDVPGSPEAGREPDSNAASGASPLFSAASPVAASRHGTVTTPDLQAEVSKASALGSLDSLESTSRHGTTPDLRTEAATPDPQLTPATGVPAEALALGAPERSASPSSDTLPTAGVTASQLPSVQLPQDTAATPPMPVRKPVVYLPASIQDTPTPPMPVRKPVIQKSLSLGRAR
jgi:uncharacterized protein YjbI with pentapeptide repeats